jgi:hypothetical protein
LFFALSGLDWRSKRRVFVATLRVDNKNQPQKHSVAGGCFLPNRRLLVPMQAKEAAVSVK